MVLSLLQVSQSPGMFLYGTEVERAPLRSGLLSGFSEKPLWVWEPGSSPVMPDCLVLPASGFSLLPSHAWVAASQTDLRVRETRGISALYPPIPHAGTSCSDIQNLNPGPYMATSFPGGSRSEIQSYSQL